jgi:hypothetical protein
MPDRYALTFSDGARRGEIVLGLPRSGRASYEVLLELGDLGAIVVRDDDVGLPRGRLLEVRSDGLWAEIIDEGDDHWSFRLEAFGLRFDTADEARASDVGERVPVGFDLEWDRGQVFGELLAGRARIAFEGTGTFEHTPDRDA